MVLSCLLPRSMAARVRLMDSSMVWLCCCNSFSMAIRSASMEVKRRVAFKFLLELGEPVVELAIVAATGLHQLADELDTAGAFGIGEARHAVKLLLFLLEDSLSLASCPVTATISVILQVALLSLSFLFRPATESQSKTPLSTFCHGLSATFVRESANQLTHCFS